MLYPVKNILFIVVFSLSGIAACKSKAVKQFSRKEKPLIILQPLEFNDESLLHYLEDSVEKFYPVEIIVANSRNFPKTFYYKPRNRYRADSTIRWLKQIKPDSATSIVGITNKDVSVNKGVYKDFGVMGLGYKPGESCVVSTFRLRKSVTSQNHFRQRLFKVVVHEMGHNFGLPHCSNEECVMVDAEGQMKLDKEKDLCESCRAKLSL